MVISHSIRNEGRVLFVLAVFKYIMYFVRTIRSIEYPRVWKDRAMVLVALDVAKAATSSSSLRMASGSSGSTIKASCRTTSSFPRLDPLGPCSIDSRSQDSHLVGNSIP